MVVCVSGALRSALHSLGPHLLQPEYPPPVSSALLLCVPWLISLMATEGSEPAVITGEKKGHLVLRRKVRMLMTVCFKDKKR